MIVAKANPKSKEAKQILKAIRPFYKQVSRDVPFGPGTREAGVSKMYALCQTFGTIFYI